MLLATEIRSEIDWCTLPAAGSAACPWPSAIRMIRWRFAKGALARGEKELGTVSAEAKVAWPQHYDESRIMDSHGAR